MKTAIGHYYVFFTVEDFWNKVNYWRSKGISWVQENHPNYNPIIKEDDLPFVLNVDSVNMGWGKIEAHRKKYFESTLFVKIYTVELRKHKLRKINNL